MLNWEDSEGRKRVTTEVVVEEQYFAEGKGGNENKNKNNTKEVEEGFYPIDESVDDDDLPF